MTADDGFDPLLRRARAAQGQNWPQALALAEELVDRFPDEPSGYIIQATSARVMKLFDRAETILAQCVTRFPSQSWPLIELVRLEQTRGDHAAVLRLTEVVRTKFPDCDAAYEMAIQSARRVARFQDAADLQAAAMSRFGGKAWPWVEAAWTDHARGDNITALKLAEALLERFPGAAGGYHVGILAARCLGRFEQAAALIIAAGERFPDRPWLLIEAAWTAQARGDDDDASRLAAIVRERFPDNEAGYQIGSVVARNLGRADEARELASEAIRRFPSQSWPLIELVRLEQTRGDHAAVLRLTEVVRTKFPDCDAAYQMAIESARRVARFQDAADLQAAAMSRFGGKAWPWIATAWTEHARGDNITALKLAEALLERFPGAEGGYHVGILAARCLGRFEQAAALIIAAGERFPDRPWLLIEAAWTAQARGDDDDASRLAAIVRERFPDNEAGYQIGSVVARNLGRADEAMELASEAIRRFPTSAWPYTEAVWTMKANDDLVEAAKWAAKLRETFPDRPEGYRLSLVMLRNADRLADIAPLLEEASLRFPSDAWLQEEVLTFARVRAEREAAIKLIVRLSNVSLVSEAGDTGTDQVNGSVLSRRVAIVLGMHRAGTSLCAHVLQQLGASLGAPLVPANRSNPEGHYEHHDIVRLHNQLLKSQGREWDSPDLRGSVGTDIWNGTQVYEIRDELKTIVSEQIAAADRLWAFKDPRTVRLLPFWKAILDELNVIPIWILCVRDPRDVVESLKIRNNMADHLAELLWCGHYIDAIRHLGSRIDVVVHYERWFSAPDEQVARLAAAAGLPLHGDLSRPLQVVQPDLRHNVHKDRPLQLQLTEQIHSRLRSERPDLGRLQREAERIWHYASGISPEAPLLPERESDISL